MPLPQKLIRVELPREITPVLRERAYDMPTRTEGMSDDEWLDLLDRNCHDDPEWMTAANYGGEGCLVDPEIIDAHNNHGQQT